MADNIALTDDQIAAISALPIGESLDIPGVGAVTCRDFDDFNGRGSRCALCIGLDFDGCHRLDCFGDVRDDAREVYYELEPQSNHNKEG